MKGSEYGYVRDVCALRFKGYDYKEDKDLAESSARAEKEFPFESNNDNFAAFFALQRRLYKWGGEMLPRNDPLFQLFDRMFLYLAPLDVPAEFASPEHVKKWQEEYQPLFEDKKRFQALHDEYQLMVDTFDEEEHWRYLASKIRT
ncbi:hypothetical protein [Leptodesmis sp.]|uniref:hypothetical protein n=1 Tax=Leptodesmis sp. TaxID=3100501 RepID=UPI004053475A